MVSITSHSNAVSRPLSIYGQTLIYAERGLFFHPFPRFLHILIAFRNKRPYNETMNITQLRYFITIAQLENMSRAAGLLHISQSSLSKNISAIEKEVGTELFERKGKNIALNPAGAQFLESCRRIVAELDNSLDSINREIRGKNSRIRIGIDGGCGKLLDCMGAFKKLFPETVFDVFCTLETETYPDISAFDVMVYPEGKKYAKFRGYPFYTERYLLAVNEKHELAGHVTVATPDLNGKDFVFLRYGERDYEFPLEICHGLAVSPNSENYTDSRTLHRQMISSGIAIGFVPESSGDLYRNDPALRLLPLMQKKFSRQMMICFKKEKHLSPLADEFRRFILDYFNLE